jgi:hypothetical protein
MVMGHESTLQSLVEYCLLAFKVEEAEGINGEEVQDNREDCEEQVVLEE